MTNLTAALLGFIIVFVSLCSGFYLISDVFSFNFTFEDLCELSLAVILILSVVRFFFISNVQQ